MNTGLYIKVVFILSKIIVHVQTKVVILLRWSLCEVLLYKIMYMYITDPDFVCDLMHSFRPKNDVFLLQKK